MLFELPEFNLLPNVFSRNITAARLHPQVAEFKEGFQFMDRDKDGVIGAGDIRATADEVGISLTDQQIDAMVADCAAAINFTQLINMFGQKQQVRLNVSNFTKIQ